MDAYHAPYTVENRYWTGLLLFIRIFFYLVSALNISGEPSTNTLAVSASMCCLLTYICILKKPIYKNKLVNTLELACYFHIIVLGIAKYHVLVVKAGDISLANTSVSISFVMFLGVMLYNVLHVTRLWNNIISLKKAKGTENFLQDPLLQNDEMAPTVTFSVVGMENKTFPNTKM